MDSGAEMSGGRGVDGSVKGGVRLLRGNRSIGSLASPNHFQKGEVTSVISGHVNIRLVLRNRVHRGVNRGG